MRSCAIVTFTPFVSITTHIRDRYLVLLIVLKYVHMFFLLHPWWGSDILVLGVVPKVMRLSVSDNKIYLT